MDIQNIILIFEAILLFLLAFYVLFRNPKQAISVSFFVMVFGAAVWVASNGLFEEYHTLFLGRTTFTGSILVVVGFIYLIMFFPYKSVRVNWIINALLILPSLVLIVVLYSTSLFISEVLSDFTLKKELFYLMFVVYYLIYWIWGLYHLLKKYQRSDGLHHWQLKNLFYAIVISLIAGLLTNLFLPLFTHVDYLGWVGPMFSIIFFGFLSYILFKKEV